MIDIIKYTAAGLACAGAGALFGTLVGVAVGGVAVVAMRFMFSLIY